MRIIALLALLVSFQVSFAQDTIYVFKKAAPIQKLLSKNVDSISVKKPYVAGKDTLIIYSNNSLSIKYAIQELDSIRFKKPYTKPDLASVSTLAAIVTSSSSAILGGNILSTGGGLLNEVGVYYSTSPNPDENTGKFIIPGGIGSFKAIITQLQPATTYYFKAFVTNDAGTTLGQELSFTTLADVPTVVSDTVNTITTTSAKLVGKVESEGGSVVTEKGFYWSSTSDFAVKNSISILNGFVADLTGLSPGKSYYYVAYAKNAQGEAYGTIKSFSTVGIAPKVSTLNASNINTYSALIKGIVVENQGSNIIEKGVVYSLNPNPTIGDSSQIVFDVTDSINVSIGNLNHNTTYYAKAYAKNKEGIAYGNEISFKTTLAQLAKVNTVAISEVTFESFWVDAEITNDGGSPIVESGIYYSLDSIPSTEEYFNKSTFKSVGNFKVNAKGGILSPTIKYYVRAYAKNAAGVSIGNSVPVKLAFKTPVLADTAISKNPTSRPDLITLDLFIKDLGFFEAYNPIAQTLSAGYVISYTNKLPTLENNDSIVRVPSDQIGPRWPSGYGILTDFYTKGGTQYYVRSFATNPAGTGYSKTDSIKTDNATPEIKLISQYRVEDTCYFTFSVVSNGGLPGAPGIAGFKTRKSLFFGEDSPLVTLGSGFGVFNGKVYCSENEAIYVFPISTNSLGEGFSIFSFAPVGPGVPSFEPHANPISVGINSASVTYKVVKMGGSSVGSTGVMYSTNPDATGGKTIYVAGGIGDFTADLIDLQAGTTYYYKALAINASGTGYSEVKSFKTAAISVGATSVSGIKGTSAYLMSNVDNDGGSPVIENGFVYSSTPNPTIDNSKLINVISSNSISNWVNDLKPFTTYYVRAYAKNALGFAYGPEKSFKTTKSLPILSIDSVSNITPSSVKINFSIPSNGGHLIMSKGVYITDDISNPTQRIINSMSTGDAPASVDVYNLEYGKLYFAYAFVITSDGPTVVSQFTGFATMPQKATFGASSIFELSDTTAVLKAEVKNNTDRGVFDILEYGFCYNLTGIGGLDTTGPKVSFKVGTSNDAIYLKLTKLKPNVAYAARPFIVNRSGLSYGNIIIFKPTAVLPTVKTLPTKAVGANGAIIPLSLESKGKSAMTKVGVVYSVLTKFPKIDDGKSIVIESFDTLVGTTDFAVTNLNPEWGYYFRTFAINSSGISYGNSQVVTTTRLATDLDGNIYDTTVIGTQTWMSQNLRTTKYNDGTPIQVATNKQNWVNFAGQNMSDASLAYYQFNNNANGKAYGLYYNFAVVESDKVCPYAWHVPSVEDFNVLIKFLGGAKTAAWYLKTKDGFPAWTNPKLAWEPSGWKATTGVYISDIGTFDVAFGTNAYWWTKTVTNNKPNYVQIFDSESDVLIQTLTKKAGVNIRCIKD